VIERRQCETAKKKTALDCSTNPRKLGERKLQATGPRGKLESTLTVPEQKQ